MCLYLATKGHNLIITGRNIEKLQNLALRIKTKYPDREIDFYSADLGLPETMNELITQARVRGIDGVVLMPPRPPILPSDPILQFQVLNKAMQDSFTGPRFLVQQLLPSMETSTLKSVILVSGTSSKQPIFNPEWEAFNDIRTTWVGCLKSFADAYGSKGIRFNTISPGQVITPTYTKKLETEAQVTTKLFTEVLREKTASASLGKLASIQGVVKTIYFFLKSSGSKEITAANVHIDGGAIRSYY